jgi:hypothetical protein
MSETTQQKAARLGLDCCPQCGWIIEYDCGCPPRTFEVPDSRQRGAWHPTPFWVFWRPAWRRPIFAHWQIGGGVDEWEYAAAIPS